MFAPVLLACACVLAGLYGALHDQISYTVSPGYFHEFKFIQFRIEDGLQNRLGAAVVGWKASWWMGAIIGVPIYLLALLVPGTGRFVRVFARASLAVVLTTLGIGIGALAHGALTITADALPWFMAGREVSNPVAFARVGHMHNFSYAGGLAGILIGAALVLRAAWTARREPVTG